MNLDVLKRFPNQKTEGRENECVGETIADIIGNLAIQSLDAGFGYAAALKAANTLPTTAGSNLYSGMVAGVLYGALPTDKVAFDVTLMNELYEANWANYGLPERQIAATYAQQGITTLCSYKDIQESLAKKIPVALTIDWHQSFNTPNPDGALPGPGGRHVNHAVAVYEDTALGLRIKPWRGYEYGLGGYAFLHKSTFEEVFREAYAFNPNAWKWLSLVYIGLSRPWLLNEILPLLKT